MNDRTHVILCIDDDYDFLESVQMVLESDGFTVVTASSAEEGLKSYKASKPDLVVVDLMMEEVDSGSTFVRDIRSLGPTPPVYMLSSVGDDFNLAADYASLGFAGVFQKPISTEVLLSVLRTALHEDAS